MKTYSIYHDFFIKSTADKIFHAITEPKHLVNWWPKKCEGKPQLNEVYNFYFAPEYDWYGKVIEIESNSKFQIKMTKSDENWDSTTICFDLQPKKDGTSVMFSQKNWPKCNEEYRQSNYCWAILLNSLKIYVEQGTIIPFKDRE